MNFSKHSIFLSLLLLTSSVAQASATHKADVTLELIQADEKGKPHVLDERSGSFSLDWNSKKCEIRLKKNQFVYCDLDTSEDIVNSKGELVMKSLPQALFNGSVVDALIREMAKDERSIKNLITKILMDTALERTKGFKLPFYTCGDCETNGKDLKLWNAYYGTIERSLEVKHLYLGQKKLILKMTIKKMEAIKGAFNTIGNNNAAEYGH